MAYPFTPDRSLGFNSRHGLTRTGCDKRFEGIASFDKTRMEAQHR